MRKIAARVCAEPEEAACLTREFPLRLYLSIFRATGESFSEEVARAVPGEANACIFSRVFTVVTGGCATVGSRVRREVVGYFVSFGLGYGESRMFSFSLSAQLLFRYCRAYSGIHHREDYDLRK